MENSASKESDPIEELKEYLNDEGKDDDPYTLLEDWLDDDDDEPKKKRRKKKTTARFSSVKRDKFGKRSYPYSGKKRYQVKKKLEQDSKTIPRHELSTPAFIFDDQYLPDTAFEDLPEETAKKKKRSWKERMERIEKAWSEEKENIFSSLRLKSAFLSKEKCALCLSKTAAVDCHECRIHLCEICDRDIHNKNPLHNRFSFVNDKTQALTPMQALNDNLEIYTVDRLVPLRHAVCICGSNNFEEIVKQGNVVVITMTGKFDLVPFVLQCCHCNQIVDPFSLKNILISGFWPSSPNNFGCLISEGVFLTWDHFRKHMPGSSSTSFLESLNDLTLHFGRQGRIVHSSFSQAFKQWNFAKYELEMSQGMDWMKCPCCSIKQHACHVDGNCKLYRYKNSGSRRRESYYEESFIAEDKKVDNFISSLQLTKGKALKSFTDTTCGGEWSAARNIERKKKSVDYTGLYVASCRHQYGLKSVNMKRGEIYAYPAYLLTTFILPNNVEYMFADVMCKLWTYLCKVDSDLPSKIKGALSVMHAKGHNLNCQVNWDGEWIQGTGKSTGEECEQLFSYLSRCANTTKYQTPENREETLTEMILFWNRRKTLNLAQNLLKKYNRITNEVSKFTSKLNNKCLEMKIDLKDVDFVSLLNKLKCFARGGITKKFNHLVSNSLIIN
uniref:CxC3 like cysteine cluster domain-containing protein n=1 Tax=Clytia hemisphaerica TaxID=252671 RepID=A0A7M5X0A6_9CNID